MVISLRIRYSDANVKKYLAQAERSLDKGSGSVTRRIGELAKARAVRWAPFDKGRLRSSIVLQRIINTKNQKSATITTTSDPDPIRRKKFGHSTWKTFVNYLHNSSGVYWKNWHGKKPDFLTNPFIYDDLIDKYETMIINIIRQSYRIR